MTTWLTSTIVSRGRRAHARALGHNEAVAAVKAAGLFLLLVSFSGAVYAQPTLTCVSGAVPPLVRAEGVTEPLGDITLQCVSSAAGTLVTNLQIFTNVP
ncbi:MAG TPA: hypothetical protein DEH78_23610, partial [Solibacterales bacterium]|nr:hypothetical protein [Bryobacterales bacterium]